MTQTLRVDSPPQRSRLGFGCVGLTLLPTTSAAERLLATAMDCGIIHFDTAPVYGRGYAEKILGAFLRGKRDRVILATKVGLPARASRVPAALALPLQAARRTVLGRGVPPRPKPVPSLLSPRQMTRREVEASFNESRQALRTDYFDLYLLHEALPWFLEPAAIDFLRARRAAGEIRCLGVAAGGANYAGVEPEKFEGWDVLQYEFGPAWPHTAPLPGRLPRHWHIFHSCLAGDHEAGAGQVLRACVAANPHGTVLFSTTQPSHLRANVRAVFDS